ncbi:MAG: hypothetical protein Q9190_003535 [Brigantiaea leucoxantha]
MTVAEWDQAFRNSGFSGLDSSVRLNPEGPEVDSVMLCTAVLNETPSFPETRIVTCHEPHELLVRRLGEQLEGFTGHPMTPSSTLLQADIEDTYAIVLALDDDFWSNLDEASLKRMQHVFSTARGILWVSRGAQQINPATNMTVGIARSIRGENAGLRFVTLDLDGHGPLPDAKAIDIIMRVFQTGFGAEDHPRFFADVEFAEMDGVISIPRVIGDEEKDILIVRETRPPVPTPQVFHQQGRPMKLKMGQVGLLDSMFFEDDKAIVSSPLGAYEVEIEIAAIGMNFKDLMISLGQIPFIHELGIECSGTVMATGKDVRELQIGDRVCALKVGSYANRVRVSQDLTVRIPASMTFTQAAAIPVVHCTAHHALSTVGGLCKGESVLIHAAAGGVGQAAIMLAQQVEAEIYATVGSVDKKALLMETYGIPEDHIFSSRDTSFSKALMAMTKQKGVDVALNSTSGEMLRHSWQCMAPMGRFIEIGKRDLVQNSNLEMEKFADSVTFAAVDIGVVADKKPLLFKHLLSKVMEMHQEGIIRQVQPLTVFPIAEMQHAMRTMQAGKHTGKIVIEAAKDSIVQVHWPFLFPLTHDRLTLTQALPAPSPDAIRDPSASYLITGGTGGLGRAITRWLARQGARHIILASRSGSDQAGVTELVDELDSLDVHVHVRKCDVADSKQVQALIDTCRDIIPPIRGVIHGAMALRDALFETISYEDWCLNIRPRVAGTWNLHNSLLNHDLDFFLCLASGSGLIGRAGQSAYAASNTFLDSFAAYRRHQNLPASVIDIGIVLEVGYVAENVDRSAVIEDASYDRITPNELLALVKAAIAHGEDGQKWQQTITGCKLIPDRKLPAWALEPKFVHVHHKVASSSTASASQANATGTSQLLAQAETWADVINVVCSALTRRLAGLLMIGEEEVDVKKPVVAYGLDSLTAVELRNWITGEMQANAPLMELMNSPSIENLSRKIAEKSRLVDRGRFGEESEKPE